MASNYPPGCNGPPDDDPEFEKLGEELGEIMQQMCDDGWSASNLVILLEEELEHWRDVVKIQTV